MKTSIRFRQTLALGFAAVLLGGAMATAAAQDRDHRDDAHPVVRERAPAAPPSRGPADHGPATRGFGRAPVAPADHGPPSAHGSADRGAVDPAAHGPPARGFAERDGGGDQARGQDFRGPRSREFFDNRYGHGHYYPPRGYTVHELPHGYREFRYHDRPYFFVDGAWYVGGPDGFVVAAPPPGLVVSVLPPFYTTLWLGGVPYYYADDVYYRWDNDAGAYEVVDPPAGADVAEAPAAPPAQRGGDQLYIYPKNGQTPDQQAQDRYECHSWATSQSGFDPTQPGGGVGPDQRAGSAEGYRRAMTACLEARGYSVQ